MSSGGVEDGRRQLQARVRRLREGTGHQCDVTSTPGLRRRISSKTRGLLYSMRTNSWFAFSKSLPSFKTANARQRVVCPSPNGRRTYRNHATKPTSADNETARETVRSAPLVRKAMV